MALLARRRGDTVGFISLDGFLRGTAPAGVGLGIPAWRTTRESGTSGVAYPYHRIIHTNQRGVPEVNRGSLMTQQPENRAEERRFWPAECRSTNWQSPRCRGAGPQTLIVYVGTGLPG